MVDVVGSGPLQVITTQDALRAGFESRQLSALVRRGEWVRLRRGVYVPGQRWRGADDVERHRLQVAGAMTTLDDVVAASHVSAAVVHRMPLVDVRLDELHMTRLPGSSSRLRAGVRHHVAQLDPRDRVRVDDMRVTGLERTAFDVARWTSRRSALVVADAALRMGADRALLLELADRWQDWPGSRRARLVLGLADARAESAGESVARLAFHDVGMPPDVLQLELSTDVGRVRCDVGWRRQRVVGEFDGKVKYGRLLRGDRSVEEVLVAERRRELAIERLGWRVVRFTWAEVHDPALVRRRLLAALRRPTS